MTAPTTIEELFELGRAEVPFTVSEEDEARVDAAYRHLEDAMSREDAKVYGVHTGFGFNVKHATTKDSKGHQRDLVTYLAVGVGEALDESIVRRGLRLQVRKIAVGISGTHPETFRRLVALADAEELPTVPRHGSLGASGDLIPMAHAVAPVFDGHDPAGPRDALSLVNTNAIMSSYAVHQCVRVSALVRATSEIVALVSLALGVDEELFRSGAFRVNSLQSSTIDVGNLIADMRGELLDEVGHTFRKVENAPIQERYSVRCSPQVLGNVADLMEFARAKIVKEAMAVADNPVVLLGGDGAPYMQHGGLFYAAGIATAADAMADVVGKTCEMLDRQVLLLMDPEQNHGLPANLEVDPGLHLKGIHQLISALMQSIRVYSAPSRALSFSAESNNQDILPCGMSALNALDEMLDKGEPIIRASHFVARRAFSLRYLDQLPEELWLEGWPSYTFKAR